MKAWLLLVLLFVLGIDAGAAWKKRVTPCGPTPLRDTMSSSSLTNNNVALDLRGGGWLPAGWNPFGYKVTALGEEFLKFEGSMDGDVGRFLASLRSTRKTRATCKANWIEVVRVAKTAQAMRVLRQLDELIAFCLKAGLLD